MANRWFLAALLFGFVMVVKARAEPGSSPRPSHVEALCHSWTESPCLLRVGGTLRHAETGRPLIGKRLRFVSAGNVICSSTTDRSGRAACVGIVPSGRTVAKSGYRILFDGDGPLLANSAEGLSIVKIGATTAQ